MRGRGKPCPFGSYTECLFGYLASGIGLGLAAGLSPGPLLALLVAQTVRYGVREGIKVAAAPVLTDAPIVAATLLLMSQLAEIDRVLGVISVVGGLYVVWLGVESLRTREVVLADESAAPHSIRKAMVINLLNPHVYVFWGTVGAPTVLRASESGSWIPAVAFVAPFYVLLCGSKMLLAVLIHRSRAFLKGAAYRRTLVALGVVLIVFGAWLVRDGVHYLRS